LQAAHSVEQRALDGNFLHIVRLRQFESLCGLQGRGGVEVEIVAVDEDFQCHGSRGRGGGSDEDAVESDLGGEPVLG
jgi:hypothetical protein